MLLEVNKKPFVLSRANGALGLAGVNHQSSHCSLQIYKVLWGDMCRVAVLYKLVQHLVTHLAAEMSSVRATGSMVFNAFPCQHLPAQPGIETVSLPQFPSMC